MNESRSIEVIKNGCPKKSPHSSTMMKNGHPKKSSRSSIVIKNGRPKKLPYSLAEIKNNRPKKLAHFRDQAMIPRTPKKTFKRQILKSRRKNTIILEEKSS